MGLSGLTLHELFHCALWASVYFVDDAAWAGLSVALRAELRRGLGVAAGYRTIGLVRQAARCAEYGKDARRGRARG